MTTTARTSLSHPIRIDEIPLNDSKGSIGLSFCPGKVQSNALTGSWDRDINADLNVIASWGAGVIVTLIMPSELTELKVEELPRLTQSLGMQWIHLPIRDRHVPDEKFMDEWATIGPALVNELNSGTKVFVHCKGGLGRAGTIAACLLIELGQSPEDAIATVRRARRGTIETLGQEEFVRKYVPVTK